MLLDSCLAGRARAVVNNDDGLPRALLEEAFAAFCLLGKRTREIGASAIRLRVHAHSRAAHQLYRKLGYQETDVMMVREIEDGGV